MISKLLSCLLAMVRRTPAPAAVESVQLAHTSAAADSLGVAWRANMRRTYWVAKLAATKASPWVLPVDMTLTRVFEEQFIPRWGHLMTDRHKAAYRESLLWWRHLTDDPPLCLVDPARVMSFVGSMPRHKLSGASIAWHRCHIDSILSFAAGLHPFQQRPMHRIVPYPSAS